jgi:hypothetical protein
LDRNVLALERIVPAPCMGRIPWLVATRARDVARFLDIAVLARALPHLPLVAG